jgi:hypothetical protein
VGKQTETVSGGGGRGEGGGRGAKVDWAKVSNIEKQSDQFIREGKPIPNPSWPGFGDSDICWKRIFVSSAKVTSHHKKWPVGSGENNEFEKGLLVE